VKRRGEALLKGVKDAELVMGESEVGGGSFPGAKFPTWLVAIRHPAPDALVARLRHWNPPIIARVADDRTLLDPRTIFPSQVDAVRTALMVDG
jgi:L-seryl-tRNA(Ser) seleniumtransferase